MFQANLPGSNSGSPNRDWDAAHRGQASIRIDREGINHVRAIAEVVKVLAVVAQRHIDRAGITAQYSRATIRIEQGERPVWHYLIPADRAAGSIRSVGEFTVSGDRNPASCSLVGRYCPADDVQAQP